MQRAVLVVRLAPSMIWRSQQKHYIMIYNTVVLGAYVAPANLSPDVDLSQALDNLANHPNTAPFITKQLIQHLVKRALRKNPTGSVIHAAFSKATNSVLVAASRWAFNRRYLRFL